MMINFYFHSKYAPNQGDMSGLISCDITAQFGSDTLSAALQSLVTGQKEEGKIGHEYVRLVSLVRICY